MVCIFAYASGILVYLGNGPTPSIVTVLLVLLSVCTFQKQDEVAVPPDVQPDVVD